MKYPKWLRRLTVVMLSILTCCVFVFLSSPLDAKTKVFNEMIDLDLIDQVAPSEDVDFNDLQETPPSSEIALIEYARLADQEAVQLPEYGLIGIPLGSVRPLSVCRCCNMSSMSKKILAQPGRFIAEGIINSRDGMPRPLFVRDVRNMFGIEIRNRRLCGISQENPSDQQVVADASGTFLQAQRREYYDIVIFDRLTNRHFALRGVPMSAICRKAINAFLNDSYYYY